MTLLMTDIQKFQIFKLLGITFFTVENGKSVTKLQDVMYMFATVGMGGFICYYSLFYNDTWSWNESAIATIGNFLSSIASTVIVMISVFITFLFRHKIWSLAQRLDTIEQKVSK